MLEKLPAEVIEEIFSHVEAIRIPSMRLISRHIASSLYRMLQLHRKALTFTKGSKMLVADYLCDLSKMPVSELKKIIHRTEMLERKWREPNAASLLPPRTWRHPDETRATHVERVFFSTKDLLCCRTNKRPCEVWNLNEDTLLGSLDGFYPEFDVEFCLTSRNPPVMVRGALLYLSEPRVITISFYEISFVITQPTHPSVSFTQLDENIIPPHSLVSYGLPRIFDSENVVVDLIEGGDAVLVCALFDGCTRMCVVDSGICYRDGITSAEVFHPVKTDHLIVQFSGLFSYGQHTFSIRQLRDVAVHVNSEAAFQVREAIETTKTSHTWPLCCHGLISAPFSFEKSWQLGQDWPLYDPASIPFRTSSVHVVKSRRLDRPTETCFHLIQFYCSANGPMTKHRLCFHLQKPYLDPESSNPICNSIFDRFCWIERHDTGSGAQSTSRLELCLVTFPRPDVDDSGKRHEDPTVSRLDVPQDILTRAKEVHICADIGAIRVQTTDHALHTIYYV